MNFSYVYNNYEIGHHLISIIVDDDDDDDDVQWFNVHLKAD